MCRQHRFQKDVVRSKIRRQAFTLVELLTVIAIIGVMASMVLIALRGAQRDSLDAKTRITIGKIHEVLAARWEEYMTQPLPVKLPATAFDRNAAGLRALSSREMSRVRLIAIRDLMRLEMPDRPGDVKFLPTGSTVNAATFETQGRSVATMIGCRTYESGSPTTGTALPGLTRLQPPAAFLAIRRALLRANNLDPARPWHTTNANEELLYQIVANSYVNGSSALELFHPTEIRDTDGDGLLEFVDAWGRPIAWIRWPAGAINAVAGDGINDFFPVQSSDPFGMTNENPLDPTNSDMALDKDFVQVNSGSAATLAPGPGLFPLVISAGSDGKHGVRFTWDGVTDSFSQADVTWPISGFSLPSGYPPSYSYPDPYHPRHETLDKKLGYVLDPGVAADNLTNYDEFGGAR
jgi:prepilin-type N-terminal cleavage/methylation domain-containing protein